MRVIWAEAIAEAAKLDPSAAKLDAQALFESAGPWLRYMLQHEADANGLAASGFVVDDPRSAPADHSERAQSAMLAISAAHQALLTGSRVTWELARRLAEQLTALGHRETLADSVSAQKAARQERDEAIRQAARALRAKDKQWPQIIRLLAAREWPDARSPSDPPRQLSRDTIERAVEPLRREEKI